MTTTIADLIRSRSWVLSGALEAIAAAVDEQYLADALRTDAKAQSPYLLENTTAVVSSDAEASIKGILARAGSGTVNELRSALSVQATESTDKWSALWRQNIADTREAIRLALVTLGISDKHVAKIVDQDAENLYLYPEAIVQKMESLKVFESRTEMINGEPYVLIG